jgi:hypothetical protein
MHQLLDTLLNSINLSTKLDIPREKSHLKLNSAYIFFSWECKAENIKPIVTEVPNMSSTVDRLQSIKISLYPYE